MEDLEMGLSWRGFQLECDCKSLEQKLAAVD